MFNYNTFQDTMMQRGHHVDKKGIYVTVTPKNERHGYGDVMDVVDGFGEELKFIAKESLGSIIYKAQYRILCPES